MKILRLQFKNLNSLQGEWVIDFTRPEYVSDGIFAITGPTGSGKSTILDAICLALYGQTPRLGKITKSSNELMSRHTGECFAEVTFASSSGTCCCRWSQHRSRRRPEGELQAQKHEISDAVTGEVIQARVQETLQAIEERTGMDFDRFTRSMLLAQGGFAAFLQAEPDRRAPVLEQITGTEIYSTISMKVHERQRAERTKLELLQAESNAVRLLGEDELNLLESDRARCFDRERELSGHAEEASVGLRWLQEIARLEEALVGIDHEASAHNAECEVFLPDARRLALARSAAALEHLFAPLQMLRGELQRDTMELSAKEALCPAMAAALQEAEIRYETFDTQLRSALEEAAAARPVISKVRQLDTQISGKLSAFDIQKQELEALAERHRQVESDRNVASAVFETSRGDLQKLQLWQTEHCADAALVIGLSGIQHALDELHPASQREAVAASGVSAASLALQKLRDETAPLKPAAAATKARLDDARKFLDGLRASFTLQLGGSTLKSLRLELEAMKERRRMLEEIAALYVSGKELAPKIADITTSIEALRDKGANTGVLLEHARQLLVMAEREVTSQEERVRLAARVRSLEDERQRLKECQPCPLCGSTHHPYADAEVCLPDDDDQELQKAKQAVQVQAVTLKSHEIVIAECRKGIEQMEQRRTELADMREMQVGRCLELLSAAAITIPAREAEPVVLSALKEGADKLGELAARIEKIETIEEQISTAETDLQQRQEASNAAERQVEQADESLRTLHAELVRIEQEHASAIGECEARRKSLLGMIEPYDAGQDTSDLDSLVEALAARSTRWQEEADRCRRLERNLQTSEASWKSLEAQLETLGKDLSAKQAAVSAASDGIEIDTRERSSLFNAKDPAAEEKRLDSNVQQARDALDEAGEARARARQELVVLDTAVQDLRSTIEGRQNDLGRFEDTFCRELQQKGFPDEATFFGARLPEAERERIEQIASGLERRSVDIASRRNDRAARLQEERERRLTVMAADEIAARIEQFQEDIREVRGEIGAIIRQLEDNERAVGEQRQKAEAVNAQKSECRRWDTLHELIGSADGKKYRNFAQGLTFEIMIAHANRQLVGMTDRYLLVRDQAEPLELSVIDLWQAGEVRSTRNLSGGESFIVSLALALGLSQMSSRNVRVDSLFLDEGFGTLDEDALETALETLSGLQQTGKLIGIISHVPALKERIATQIRVFPLTGGRSALSGPGVVNRSCPG
jgi:exonuclease SbcC